MIKELAKKVKRLVRKALKVAEEKGVNSSEFAEAEKAFLQAREEFNRTAAVCPHREKSLCTRLEILTECDYHNCKY